MEQEQQVVSQNTSVIPKKPSMRRSIFFIRGKTLFIFVAVILLGILTGYLISQFIQPVSSVRNGSISSKTSQKAVYGSSDEKIFKDIAQGLLKEGGIDGEGSHHLERPGGISQNVYLTSSVVDLSQFVGKNVKVWGQTYQAEKAGWLMDVGKLQVL